MLKPLDQSKTGERGRVVSVSGGSRLLSRAAAVGITLGCEVEVLQNRKSRPVLIYERDTVIAVGRKVSEKIMVEVVPHEV